MWTAKTLIRLGGCPGWSKSMLGHWWFCWFCHEVAPIVDPMEWLCTSTWKITDLNTLTNALFFHDMTHVHLIFCQKVSYILLCPRWAFSNQYKYFANTCILFIWLTHGIFDEVVTTFHYTYAHQLRKVYTKFLHTNSLCAERMWQSCLQLHSRMLLKGLEDEPKLTTVTQVITKMLIIITIELPNPHVNSSHIQSSVMF